MAQLKRVFQVDGKPFFPLGGQAKNSSGYNRQEAETAFRAVVAMHGNTLEIPVYWEQVEPVEGAFDFAAVDTLLALALCTWAGNGSKMLFGALFQITSARFDIRLTICAATPPAAPNNPERSCTAARNASYASTCSARSAGGCGSWCGRRLISPAARSACRSFAPLRR